MSARVGQRTIGEAARALHPKTGGQMASAPSFNGQQGGEYGLARQRRWERLGAPITGLAPRAPPAADRDVCSDLSRSAIRADRHSGSSESRAVVPSICLTGAEAIAQYPGVEWVSGAGVSTNRRGDSEWHPPGVVAGVAGAELPGRLAPRMGSASGLQRRRGRIRRIAQSWRHLMLGERDRADPLRGSAPAPGGILPTLRFGAPGAGFPCSSQRARRAAARAAAPCVTPRRGASPARIDAVQSVGGPKKMP
jgi:hypothetical protein